MSSSVASPNLILITTDQQRHDTVGPSAPSFLRTPHVDHLANQGVTFDRAYADNPLCVPSRMAIMTGRSVHTHGMLGNGRTSDAMGRAGTLPAQLAAIGYHTIAVGKMHFSPQRARHGFHEMTIPDDYYRSLRSTDHRPMRHGLGQNEIYPGRSTVPESHTLTAWTADQCVDFIRERRDPTAPFFLWASFSKPHPPLDPPEPYYSMYRDSPIPDPVHGDWSTDERCPPAIQRTRQRASSDRVDPEVLRAARTAYYGLVTQVDYAIGRVFAALQDRGLFDDALILFTSDHGDYLGDHGLIGKTFFHDVAARIPMVLRLPQAWDDRRPGTTCSVPVTLADVLPTLVGAGGGQPAADAEGNDLVAVAREAAPAPRLVEGMSFGPSPDQQHPLYLAVTDGRWKYIWYVEGGYEQLFDLEADPEECHDLAADPSHRERCDHWHRELVTLQRRRGSAHVNGDRLRRTEPALDAEADRRNRSWPGYHTESHPADVRH